MSSAVRAHLRGIRQGRGRGFTLIEMLTVIGILLFMMAMITGVFIRVQQRARMHATQALIEKIGVALAMYRAETRSQPPDSGCGLDKDTKKGSVNEVLYDPGTLWRYLSQPLVMKRASDGKTVKRVGPYISFKEGELQRYDDTTYGKSYIVVDGWNNPIGYIGDPKRVIHNRGDFDLFSPGPDRKTACNDGLDNDENGGADEANTAYDGAGNDDAAELGESAFNGCLTATKKTVVTGEVLDDINNWDPQR